MRIAPRTSDVWECVVAVPCGYRARFVELRDLCSEADDKSSLAMAMSDVIGRACDVWHEFEEAIPAVGEVYGPDRVDRGPGTDHRAFVSGVVAKHEIGRVDGSLCDGRRP